MVPFLGMLQFVGSIAAVLPYKVLCPICSLQIYRDMKLKQSSCKHVKSCVATGNMWGSDLVMIPGCCGGWVPDL
jgi:hypothetical protein